MTGHFEIIRYEDDEEVDFAGLFINTPHNAHMLIDDGVYIDESSLDAAMERTFQVCLHLNIPIRLHFRRIHVHDTYGHVQDEWALSDLALYLLLINGDTHNEYVALAQAHAIKSTFNK